MLDDGKSRDQAADHTAYQHLRQSSVSAAEEPLKKRIWHVGLTFVGRSRRSSAKVGTPSYIPASDESSKPVWAAVAQPTSSGRISRVPPQILIRRAEVQEVLDLRWRILRAGLARETANFDGDHEPTTRHLAAVMDNRIVGCVTILRRPWQGKPAWQMRGMAIEDGLQRSGIGRKLIDEVERIVRTEEHSLQLWCNARSPAVPFYQKLGWRIEGEEFVIPTAGPHFKMTKLVNDKRG
jgi:GNAT superfamily N-acetyltransferase